MEVPFKWIRVDLVGPIEKSTTNTYGLSLTTLPAIPILLLLQTNMAPMIEMGMLKSCEGRTIQGDPDGPRYKFHFQADGGSVLFTTDQELMHLTQMDSWLNTSTRS